MALTTAGPYPWRSPPRTGERRSQPARRGRRSLARQPARPLAHSPARPL